MRIQRLLALVVGLLSAACLAGTARSGERIAASAEQVQPLGVGAAAPSVTLRDVDGRDVALAALWGEKPVVLIFYRGGW